MHLEFKIHLIYDRFEKLCLNVYSKKKEFMEVWMNLILNWTLTKYLEGQILSVDKVLFMLKVVTFYVNG